MAIADITESPSRLWIPPAQLVAPAERPLDIAMVVPAFVKTPPEGYGGTESFAACLAEYLIKIGHNVTIYACEGSYVDGAKMVPILDGPLKERPEVGGDYARTTKDNQCAGVALRHIQQTEPDVVINNYGYVYLWQHQAAGLDSHIPVLTPIHSNLYGETADQYFYTELGMPLISISNKQREDAKGLPWFGNTIHHGIKLNAYPFNAEPDPDNHAVCISRADMSKSPHIAAKAAARAGMKIVMVVKTEETDACNKYMRDKMMPVVEAYPDLIKLMNEQSRKNVARIIGKGVVAIHTMGGGFHEPLGLVLEEYASAGVPVVAQRRGSIRELVINGRTGNIVDDMECETQAQEEALIESIVQVLPQTCELYRSDCREHAEANFPHELMGWKYNKAMNLVLAA